MDWKHAKHVKENEHELPGNWLHIHYFDALNVLFRIENTLRLFVYVILKTQLKSKWLDLSITSDDEETSTINSISKRRISQDNNHAYLGYEISNPLLHLTAGELIRIITSEAYWKYFKSYFLGSKEIIRNKLDEIGNVRNSLAHFRPIKSGNVDLIKQNANHTLPKIEKTLFNIMDMGTTVPTNTKDEWYLQLKNLSCEYLNLKFTQSEDEEWIKIILQFYAPMITPEKNEWGGHQIYLLTFKPYALLKEHTALKEFVVAAQELPTYNSFNEVDEIKVVQRLLLNFSRLTIQKHYETIRDLLIEVFNDITDEIELIKLDSLASGKLVKLDKKYISSNRPIQFPSDSFLIGKPENLQLPEFWGIYSYPSRHLITDIDIYPWMPESISNDKTELPF